jgi:hypothetical protein
VIRNVELGILTLGSKKKSIPNQVSFKEPGCLKRSLKGISQKFTSQHDFDSFSNVLAISQLL